MPPIRLPDPRRKKHRLGSAFFRNSSIDPLDFDFDGDGDPFCDDELLTLDEFESFHSTSHAVGEEKPPSAHQRIDPPEKSSAPRRKVARRRQIDPTTCEREYTTEEVEFMNALSEYKRNSGRMFPTCSEILEVLKRLGYEKIVPCDVPEVIETEALYTTQCQ